MPAFSAPERYFMRIQLYNRTPHFGKGVVSLMTLVGEGHSMRSACKELGLAYSKAFKIIKAAEEDVGFALISGTAGGTGGGGSELTAEGKELLRRYQDFERDAQTAVDALFAKYFTP